MIIQCGKGDESAYGKWADGSKVFISRPYFKIVLNSGLGVYVMNAFRFNLFPRFYGTFHKTFWEFGVSFVGWTLEVMWNKTYSK
jgi:hypothetical protein